MNNPINSSTGLLLVNANGNIVVYNKLAKSILKSNLLLKKDINSILSSVESNYTIEKIELETNENDLENIKYIYLLRPLSHCDTDLFKKILENSHDEIFVTDGSGNTVYCNDNVEKHYGIKRSQIIGKKFWLLKDVEFIGEPAIPLVLKEKKQISVKHKTSIGKKLFITATPVFNKKGDIEIIVTNTRDVTELENIRYTLAETQKIIEKYKKEVEELRKNELKISNELVFKSSKIKKLVNIINRVAHVDTNILILGESGTGKSVFAKYIHKISHRKDGPFITINCAAIPEHLIESELFGYEPGAFTGAKKEGKVGLVELADEGTLFLDEIGELPLNVQAKFLEFIQEQCFTPVGGIKSKKVNIRIISATNRDLSTLVEEKKFREDLYYRLKVVELNIPPLKDRPEDIFSLINFYINKFDKKYRFSHKISQECIELMLNYSWPGNVRELQNITEQLVVTVPDNIIEPYHLPNIFHHNTNSKFNVSFRTLVPLDFAMEKVEKELLLKAYKQLGSSYKVANALGISQSKASRKLRKYLNR